MFWNHTSVLTMLNEGSGIFHSLVSTHFTRGSDGDLHLVYHGTILVTYHQDNTFSLFAGGYRTKTTKNRLCEFGPVTVFQKDGEWFLDSPEGPESFFDGIRVDSFGEPIDPDDYEELNPDWGDPREMTIDNQIGKMYL